MPTVASVSGGSDRASTTGAGRGYLVVLALTMVLYGVSAAPDIVWQDAGMAIMRTWHGDYEGRLGLALSHPGYYLLTGMASSVPWGEFAWRVNVFSAICGALAVANVWLLIRVWTGDARAAAIGAIALAVSHTFWRHASIAEIYTLMAVGMTAEWLLLSRYLSTNRRRWLVLLALLNGYNISVHLLCGFGLVAYVAVLIVRTARRLSGLRDWLWVTVAWLIGLTPMLWLIVARLAGGQGSLDVLMSVLFGESGNYARGVLNLSGLGSMLVRSGAYVGMNFPTPAVLLVVLGLASRAWPGESAGTMRRVLVGLLIAFALFAVRYRVVDQYVFFIPAYVVTAIFIGVGAAWWLKGRSGWRLGLAVVAALLPVGVYAVLPGVVKAAGVNLGVKREIPYRDAYTYFLRPWRTGYHGARRFAVEALDAVGDGGVLIADSTIEPVLRYVQQVNGIGLGVRVQGSGDVGPDAVTELNIGDQLRAGRVVAVCSDRPGYVPKWLLGGDSAQSRFVLTEAGVVYRVVMRADHR